MTARPTRFTAARRLSAVAVGAAALLAACGAELPTAADLQGMDVARAEARIGQAVELDGGRTIYVVNGQQVAAGAARSIAADSIVTINVRKTGNRANEIRIVTKGTPLTVSEQPGKVLTFTGKGDTEIVVVQGRPLAAASAQGEPLFFIDGRKSAKADMDKLHPSQIQSIEVIKGPAATAKFGAEGQFGAVMVFTKPKP